MKAIFVTGTDTGIGKSLVCGFLGRYFLEKGEKVATQKWIQTGSEGFSQDLALHLRLMGRSKKDINVDLPYMNPYVFKHPSSPHLSSRLEKKKISKQKIKSSLDHLKKKYSRVIIEGSGGALVPFDDKALMIDIAKELNLPVLLVVGNKLGAINHTLLTLEALKRRKMKIIGVVFNNCLKKADPVVLNDNPRIVRKISKANICGVLPFSRSEGQLYEKFVPIAKRIKL